jgi:hypothetical protein
MLIGELYYYDKTLDQIQFPLTSENSDKVEIYGVPKITQPEVNGLSSIEIGTIFRDKFSKAFAEALNQQKIPFTTSFWSALTSPYSQNESRLTSSSQFQEVVLEWAKDGFKISDLSEVLKLGRLTSTISDFSLYYGLKVIYLLTTANQSQRQTSKIDYPKTQEADQITQNKEILVLTTRFIAPLFTNLNCAYLPLTEDPKIALDNVRNELSKNHEIKLIIIEGENPDLIKHLQRNLPPNILITGLELEVKNSNQSQTYFDLLVKKTLGIRIPE